MYLSQLILNPRCHIAQADLSNPYELHRTVMRGFPSPTPASERVLFRLEPFDREGFPSSVVLVQSIDQPDWTTLSNRRDYLLQEPLVKDLNGMRFRAGQVLRFRLRANPIKRNASSGKRMALTRQEEREAWLLRKAKQGGFAVAVETLNIRDTNIKSFAGPMPDEHEPEPGRPHEVTVHSVDYDGLLLVQEPERFQIQLQQGIGPAKGMGCGLLSLAPLGS